MKAQQRAPAAQLKLDGWVEAFDVGAIIGREPRELPFAPALMCGGHTHLQQIRRLGDTLFFNPGSVGFAYSHQQPEENFKADPWAEYAVLSYEDGRMGLELRRVPYSAEVMIQTYLASGRPHANQAAAQYRAG